MDSKNNIFRDYIRTEHLDEEFENSVFLKIKKKKKQRTIALSSLGAFLLGGILFVSGNIFFPGKNTQLLTKRETFTREDVPLTDYVIFAASDESNNYVIEQVGNFEDQGTI